MAGETEAETYEMNAMESSDQESSASDSDDDDFDEQHRAKRSRLDDVPA